MSYIVKRTRRSWYFVRRSGPHAIEWGKIILLDRGNTATYSFGSVGFDHVPITHQAEGWFLAWLTLGGAPRRFDVAWCAPGYLMLRFSRYSRLRWCRRLGWRWAARRLRKRVGLAE